MATSIVGRSGTALAGLLLVLASVGQEVGLAANTVRGTTSGWHTYHNVRAGYSVEYPVSWVVHETTTTTGWFMTTFTPANGRGGVTVTVRPVTQSESDMPDIPKRRCHQVKVAGLSGTQCFDTLAFTVSTTLVETDKIYSISTPVRHNGHGIYQHIVSSFRLTT